MALREAASEIVIDIPRSAAWEKLRDLSRAHDYVQSVRDTRMDTAQAEGVGASRTVFLKDGTEMQETVEEWDEGRGMLLRLHKGDKPAMPVFRRFYFRYALEDAPGRAGEATLFRPALLYEPKGLAGWLVSKLAHGKMQQSAHDVGVAMKEFYETGQPVTAQRFAQLKAGSER